MMDKDRVGATTVYGRCYVGAIVGAIVIGACA
jgi:hypothetical protein